MPTAICHFNLVKMRPNVPSKQRVLSARVIAALLSFPGFGRRAGLCLEVCG